MTYNLDPLEAVTVRAFLEALAKIDQPLPPELQQEINKVGQIVATDPKTAVDTLLDLSENLFLKPFYEAARLDIQTQYVTQECRDLELDKDTELYQGNVTALDTLAQVINSLDSTKEAKDHYLKFVNIFSCWFKRKRK